MSKIPKFCPECGVEMGGKPVCEKCGFDTKITEDKKMSEKKSGSSSTWDSLEPIVTFAGKWAWIWGVIVGIVYIIVALVALPLAPAAADTWEACNILFPGTLWAQKFWVWNNHMANNHSYCFYCCISSLGSTKIQ